MMSERGSGSPSHTASAASSVQPPAKTANRRNSVRSAGAQQIVAPVDRRPQRPLALEYGPAAARQQVEAIVKPRGDLLDRHRGRARGCELEGERDAIQPTADPRHGRGVGGRERKLQLHLTDAVDEQPHRLVLQQTVPARDSVGWLGTSSDGTRHAISPATRSASRLVASTRRPDVAPRSRSTSSAQASIRCSQLSSSSSNLRPCTRRSKLSSGVRPEIHGRQAPTERRSGRASRRRSTTGPRTRRRPGNRRDMRRATSTASRVLPQPPAPVSVTRRAAARALAQAGPAAAAA